MPIEAIAITNSTATGMSVSCSGVLRSLKRVDLGSERDHREGDERRDGRDDRRQHEDDLVGGLRDDVLLQRQLHAVGQRLQQAEGAVHVGADAVLHPGHDPALPPDVEQRQQHQDHEDQHGLDRGSSHQGSWPKSARSSAAIGDQLRRFMRRLPSRVTRLPGEARSASTPLPKRVGRHPHDAVGEVGDLGRQRHRAAVTGEGDGRADGVEDGRARDPGDGRARRWRGRCLSPSCIEPLSSSCFQVASARPSPVVERRPGPRVMVARGAVPRTHLLHLRRAPRRRCGSRAALPQLLGDAGQDAQVGQRGRVGEDRVEGPRPALPGDEHAGLVGRPGRPGRRRRQRGSRRSRAARGRPRTTPPRCAARVAAGSAGVVGVDAADRPGRRARRRRSAATIASASRPAVSGRWSTPQAVAASTRAAASATGRPPGSRLGRQPVSTAPRSPARRGTQASRAPVFAASAAAAVSAPGTVASRSPTRITAVPSTP